MKRLLGGLALLVLVVLLVMVVRTVRLVPPPAETGDPAAPIAIDTVGAAGRLAGAVRFPTVSYASGGPIDTAAFAGLHQYLATAFPARGVDGTYGCGAGPRAQPRRLDPCAVLG
ncbi:MAG: hypothetical protein H6R40_1610 [Gemmatimonadetes bacterium]|nr:hypothetical protein [Gemmatimonadota bacterium]